jgi:hypothetical protein
MMGADEALDTHDVSANASASKGRKEIIFDERYQYLSS